MVRANDVCDDQHANTMQIKSVQEQMPDSATLLQVAEILAALAVPTRARIVFALAQAELCVCDLAALLGMTVSAISHQLRLLRRIGLVKYRKEGRLAYYSLDDEHASGILTQVLDHVKHRQTQQATCIKEEPQSHRDRAKNPRQRTVLRRG